MTRLHLQLAAATQEEKAVGLTSRLQLRNVLAPQARPGSLSPSPSFVEESATRRIGFGPPTYVDHPGDNPSWSDEEFEEDFEGEGMDDQDEADNDGSDEEHERALEDDGMGDEGYDMDGGSSVLDGMEPDDGMSWDDEAGAEDQASHLASIGHRPPVAGFARKNSSESIEQSIYKEGPQAQQAQLVNQPQLRQGPEPASAAFPHPDSPSSSRSPTSPNRPVLGRILLPSEIARSNSQSSVVSRTSQNSASSPLKSTGSRDFLDPALETGETRRIFATPALARSSPPTSYLTGESLQPEMKRNVSLGSIVSSGGESTEGERESDVNSPTGDGKQKKKNSVFGSLFKKKDKKDKGIRASSGESEGINDASPTEDGRSTQGSPSSDRRSGPIRTSTSSSRISTSSSTDNRKVTSSSDPTSPTGGPHSLRLQQIDQKQQALYQQYLAQTVHSPDSQTHPSLSYGTQAAAAVAQSSATQRLARASMGSAPKPRPGSLIVSPNPNNAHDAPIGSETPSISMLSVLRIFAGRAIDSESTFKTVLLNESTTTNELLQQAIQRFGVGKAETLTDYCLMVKGVDGDEEILGAESRPSTLR